MGCPLRHSRISGVLQSLLPQGAITRVADIDTGVLYHEDNLSALTKMSAESVDLIYLDPPFFSNRSYEVIWGDEAEVRSFEDRWEGGISHYIDWMHKRVIQLHRVLKPTGSIYLHCDPHASHYLKVMLDEVFGANRFRNELIWQRHNARTVRQSVWPRLHDTILHYAKGPTPFFQATQVLSSRGSDPHDLVKGPAGKKHRTKDLTGPETRNGETGQPWRGINPTDKGRHWRVGHDTLEALDKAGRLYWQRNGMPREIAEEPYIASDRESVVGDVWTDIDSINAGAAERLGYPTQKPEALLARIIEASSDRGHVVLDPFCGCVTTISVAQKLGRQWIGVDISPTALNIMRDRMSRIMSLDDIEFIGLDETEEALRGYKPFEFQNWVIRQFVGTHSARKSGDMGIDGYSFMEANPIQVKRSDKVGRNVIDNFETAMRRGRHGVGYIVAFSFTRNAVEEVARARWKDGLEIRLITVANLLQSKLPDRIPELAQVKTLPIRTGPPPEARPTAEELIRSDLTAAS